MKSKLFTKDQINNLSKLHNTIVKDRLAPSQYAALRKLGYNENRWKNMTSEQASRIIAQTKAKKEGQSGPEKAVQPKGKKEGQTEVPQQKSASSSQEEGKKQLAQFKKDFEHYFDDYWTAMETGKRSDNPGFASWSEMKEADIDRSEYEDVKAEYEYLTKKAAGTLTPEEEKKHQAKQQKELKNTKNLFLRSQKKLAQMKQILSDPQKRKEQAVDYEGKPVWNYTYYSPFTKETAETKAMGEDRDDLIRRLKKWGLELKSLEPVSNEEYFKTRINSVQEDVDYYQRQYNALKKKYGVSDSIKRENKLFTKDQLANISKLHDAVMKQKAKDENPTYTGFKYMIETTYASRPDQLRTIIDRIKESSELSQEEKNDLIQRANKSIGDSCTKDGPVELTNGKLIKQERYYDPDAKRNRTLSMVEYTSPSGYQMWGILWDYNGEKTWTNGGVFDVSRRLAEQTFANQLELSKMGNEAYRKKYLSF